MGSGQPVSAGSSAATELASAHDLLYRRQMPAWLLSFGIHLAFFVVLAVAVPHLPQGAAEETTRTGGIVLVSRAAGPPQYLSEEEAGGSLTSTDSSALANPSGSAQATEATSDANQKIESELAGLLPQGSESLAGSASVGLGADQAQEMTQGTLGPKLGAGHNYAETGVFGVKGRGTKFVYVFDRSGSMDGFGGRPLAAAKRELLASLNDLDTVHQFQVIFYNERPTLLNPDHSAHARLLFGNETDRKAAGLFIKGILADGGTSHLDALKMALRMKPDVIFFLTDADEPTLTHTELETIRKLNGNVGCSINAIEFGAGPRQARDNFLVRIARENSGAHVYIDVTKLPVK